MNERGTFTCRITQQDGVILSDTIHFEAEFRFRVTESLGAADMKALMQLSLTKSRRRLKQLYEFLQLKKYLPLSRKMFFCPKSTPKKEIFRKCCFSSCVIRRLVCVSHKGKCALWTAKKLIWSRAWTYVAFLQFQDSHHWEKWLWEDIHVWALKCKILNTEKSKLEPVCMSESLKCKIFTTEKSELESVCMSLSFTGKIFTTEISQLGLMHTYQSLFARFWPLRRVNWCSLLFN